MIRNGETAGSSSQLLASTFVTNGREMKMDVEKGLALGKWHMFVNGAANPTEHYTVLKYLVGR